MVTTKEKQSHFKRSPPVDHHHHIILITTCPPTCIIILSSMRSGSVGIAGHLGPIPPAAGKTPRDHLQFEATPSSPLPFLGGLNWPHSSLIALHASDLPVAAKPKLPVAVSSQPGSISSSQEFTFSAFVAFSDSIAIVSPWPHAISAQLFLQVR